MLSISQDSFLPNHETYLSRAVGHGYCLILNWQEKCVSVSLCCRRQAHLCILSNSVDEPMYTKLIEALCAEHGINLLKVFYTILEILFGTLLEELYSPDIDCLSDAGLIMM